MNKSKWKKGFCMLAIDGDSLTDLLRIKKYADMCEKFVLGIPDEESLKRIYNNKNIDNYSEIVNFLDTISWIDRLLILNKNQMNYMTVYEMVSFDVCFVGSDFGKAYRTLIDQFSKLNISVVFNSPEKYHYLDESDPISMMLYFLPSDYKIILFGTGTYFDIYIKNYAKISMPAYAIDNDKNKWGTKKNGINIMSPEVLKSESEDKVIIVICSKKVENMLEQLKSLGNFDYRLMLYHSKQSLMEEFGFFISKEDDIMGKIHNINYQMLKELVRVCNDNNIQYYLAYGSLLGAVRNGGPIPWDNDIDILFTRKEYEKIIKCRNDFSEEFFLVTPDDFGKNKYFDSVSRLLYKNAYVKLDSRMCKYYNNLNNRLNIDLFLLDKTYDGLKGKIHRTHLAIIYGLMNAYRYQGMVTHYGKKQRLQNSVLRFIGKLIPLAFLRKRAAKVASKYDNDSKAKYYIHSTGDLQTLNELYPADIFNKTSIVRYNDLEVMAPADPDAFLKIKYGDYMTPVDAKYRFPHWGPFRISSGLFEFEDTEK